MSIYSKRKAERDLRQGEEDTAGRRGGNLATERLWSDTATSQGMLSHQELEEAKSGLSLGVPGGCVALMDFRPLGSRSVREYISVVKKFATAAAGK